ncbi:flavin reductase [Variovorax guangxiensis]|uniref:Flavin reductase n=1 Tax=Variovorax guangxiensis TaxID=1775474 RepID=A0A3S0XJN5_9BURK|nr:flavin reductase [Variovorax guangxiensis]
MKRRVAIVGAGQSGMQLALGLQRSGLEVTVFSNRSAQEIGEGPVMSSQCMFETALQTERELGLDWWADECPPVEGIGIAVRNPEGGKAIEWSAKLDGPAQSVDQRLKIPAWMAEFERRGGRLVLQDMGIDDLETCARMNDLVVVASGKGEISRLFERDDERSPYEQPQRALALTYVKGMKPRASHSAVCFNLIPGVGEYFVFPALTTTGPCEIMVFEGVPGGPMDCWADVKTPQQHLARSKWILETFLPWEAERCRDIELTDDNGILSGRFTPTVRKPVARLPSGRKVLGLADAVVLNDPITGQGSNNAAKCADIYLKRILEHGDAPFDAAWMQQTFDRYWEGYARWATGWTNSLLAPPQPHLQKLLQSAASMPAVASIVVNGFDDPRAFAPWWFDAAEADRFLEDRAREAVVDRFDRRDFRKALGQFSTGVTVITTRAMDGRRVGMTANSFSSVSLDPPLVLWSLARQAPSLADFTGASHFAINVLAANQHHLSRQFSTPQADKFGGVECCEGTSGVPLLNGVIARFVCRNVRQYDGGDHLIFIGEVERYDRFDGEPLVFHSGYYQVTTRHPECMQ